MEDSPSEPLQNIPEYGDPIYILNDNHEVAHITWVYEFKDVAMNNCYKVIDKTKNERIVTAAKPLKPYHKRPWRTL